MESKIDKKIEALMDSLYPNSDKQFKDSDIFTYPETKCMMKSILAWYLQEILPKSKPTGFECDEFNQEYNDCLREIKQRAELLSSKTENI